MASNPSTPQSILADFYRRHRAVGALASNPSTPPAILERILLHDYKNVKPRLVTEVRQLDGPDMALDAFAGERAARNPGMPFDPLSKLMRDGSVWAYRYAACNMNAPGSVLDDLSRVSRDSLVSIPGLKRFIDTGVVQWGRPQKQSQGRWGDGRVQALAQKEDVTRCRRLYANGALYEILHNVAYNPATPVEVLVRLSQQGLCALMLAENPNTPSSVLEQISHGASHGDALVAEALATNPNTPPAILESLASDRPSKLSALVAGNPGAPQELVDLLSDPKGRDAGRASTDQSWREDVLMGVAGNSSASVGALQRSWDHFSGLTGPSDSEKRAKALLRLAENPATPRHILDLLVEADGACCMAVLQNPSFDPSSLLERLPEA